MNAARLARRWQEAAGDPARMAEALVDEIDDPATGLVSRDFLRAELTLVRQELAALGGDLRKEMADLRQELAELRSELRQDMAGLRSELRQDMAGHRSELRQDMASLEGGLRQEMISLESRLRQDMARLRGDLRGEIWRVVLTVFGAQVVLVGILVTLLLEFR